MNELERIVRETASLGGEAYVLATVVRVSGSSYRRPGARMLVAGDRWLSGCVSGGCLEGDVLLRGAHRCEAGPVVVRYDSTDGDGDGEPWLGCNGVVDVLLEHVPVGGANDVLGFARACFADERSGVLATVIGGVSGLQVGMRVAVGPACELANPVRDPGARAALLALASGAPGVHEVPSYGATVLVETIAPSPQLFVLGSGHDAAPVVTLARSVGFRAVVADRAIREPSRFLAAHRTIAHGGDWAVVAAAIEGAADAFVVVMHHQLGPDREALAVALASRARYIGVLGPARRTRDLIGARAGDARLHAPIGLDVGAETPEQIALAIVGEIQAVAQRARGGKLRDRARALHAPIATIVLAAGGSRRLGHAKQLVELDGEPLVRRVARTCLELRSGPVGVVLGARAGEVDAALGALPVTRVPNEAWSEGIASSIRAGVRWAESLAVDALLVVLADQPLLSQGHLGALRESWLGGAPIAASRFDDTLGAPAVFDRSRWPALTALSGDRGAGAIVRSAPDAVAIDWPDGALDVDTADDVHRLSEL